MSTSAPAAPVPADLLEVETGARAVGLTFDSTAYPVVAAYGAAFVFLDRCYVLLDHPAQDAKRTRVTLSLRASGGAPDAAAAKLGALAAEFAEELVSNAWRAGIEADTRKLIEGATSRAHGGGGGAGGPPSLDDLASYDFAPGASAAADADAMADPLGIAVSWEKKHAPPKDP